MVAGPVSLPPVREPWRYGRLLRPGHPPIVTASPCTEPSASSDLAPSTGVVGWRHRWRPVPCHIFHLVSRESTDGDGVTEEEQDLWSLLDNINGWLRFADGKAATTIAISSAVATVVAADAAQSEHAALYLSLSATSIVAAAGAIVSALIALLPQTESEDDRRTTVFFGHIADFETAEAYLTAARSTRDGGQLAVEVAHQIHENARIAARKYKWVGLGVQFVAAQLILGVLLMAINTLEAF
jgi:hypothetical protein